MPALSLLPLHGATGPWRGCLVAVNKRFLNHLMAGAARLSAHASASGYSTLTPGDRGVEETGKGGKAGGGEKNTANGTHQFAHEATFLAHTHYRSGPHEREERGDCGGGVCVRAACGVCLWNVC